MIRVRCGVCGQAHPLPECGPRGKAKLAKVEAPKAEPDPKPQPVIAEPKKQKVRAPIKTEATPEGGKFDRVAYQKAYIREYMRKRRAGV